MLNDYLWVLALDKSTGDMVHFTRCHKNNSRFYAETYVARGHDAKIMTSEEMDEMTAQDNANKKTADE